MRVENIYADSTDNIELRLITSRKSEPDVAAWTHMTSLVRFRLLRLEAFSGRREPWSTLQITSQRTVVSS
jgi:hypothetical protein